MSRSWLYNESQRVTHHSTQRECRENTQREREREAKTAPLHPSRTVRFSTYSPNQSKPSHNGTPSAPSACSAPSPPLPLFPFSPHSCPSSPLHSHLPPLRSELLLQISPRGASPRLFSKGKHTRIGPTESCGQSTRSPSEHAASPGTARC